MGLDTIKQFIREFGWFTGLRMYAQRKAVKSFPRGWLVRTDVPRLRAPVFLRARTTDPLVLKQVLFEGNFDFPLPVSPSFIIDAGANIGLASAALATRFPDARIVAVELDPGNFKVLQRNVKPYPNVTPMHAGLWSHATPLAVANPDTTEWAFRAREVGTEGSASTVPGLTVSDIMRRFGVTRVDLLKVDIEGGEREVFGPSADEWIGKVSVIAVELHDRLVPGCEAAVAGRLGGFTRTKSGEYDLFQREAPAR